MQHEKFIKAILKLQKNLITEHELHLFAESDIKSLPSTAKTVLLISTIPAYTEKPKRKKICLQEYHFTMPHSAFPPAALPVLPDGLRTPAIIIPIECAIIPVTSKSPAEQP